MRLSLSTTKKRKKSKIFGSVSSSLLVVSNPNPSSSSSPSAVIPSGSVSSSFDPVHASKLHVLWDTLLRSQMVSSSSSSSRNFRNSKRSSGRGRRRSPRPSSSSSSSSSLHPDVVEQKTSVSNATTSFCESFMTAAYAMPTVMHRLRLATLLYFLDDLVLYTTHCTRTEFEVVIQKKFGAEFGRRSLSSSSSSIEERRSIGGGGGGGGGSDTLSECSGWSLSSLGTFYVSERLFGELLWEFALQRSRSSSCPATGKGRTRCSVVAVSGSAAAAAEGGKRSRFSRALPSVSTTTTMGSSCSSLSIGSGLTPERAFRTLLNEIFMNARFGVYRDSLPVCCWNRDSKDVETVCWEHDEILRRVFLHFCRFGGKGTANRNGEREEESLDETKSTSTAVSEFRRRRRNVGLMGYVEDQVWYDLLEEDQMEETNAIVGKLMGDRVIMVKKRKTNQPEIPESNSCDFDRDQRLLSYNSLMEFAETFGLVSSSDVMNAVSQFDLGKIHSSLFHGTLSSSSHHKELISFNDFKNLLLRVSVFIYDQPASDFCGQPHAQMLNYLLNTFEAPFRELFAIPMHTRLVDLSRIPPPVLYDLSPNPGLFSGSTCVVISGDGFDVRRGGVYARIVTRRVGKIQMVRARSLSDDKKRATFIFPPVDISEEVCSEGSPGGVQLSVNVREYERMRFEVSVSNRLDMSVSVTNDRETFSQKSLDWVASQSMEPFALQHEITFALLDFYRAYHRLTPALWSSLKKQLRRLLPQYKYAKKLPTRFVAEQERIFGDVKDPLTFSSFIQLLTYFVVSEVFSVHPIDYFIDLVSLNSLLSDLDPSSSDSEDWCAPTAVCTTKGICSLFRPQGVFLRPTRLFEVFSGPLLVGRVEEDQGGGFRYIQLSRLYEEPMARIVEFSENMNHFLCRCIRNGMDVGAPSSRSEEDRFPIGRCWSIVSEKDFQKRLGAVWDYPGTFASLRWVPLVAEAEKECFMMCVYEDCLVEELWVAFACSRSLTHLRNNVERIGLRMNLSL